MYTDSILRVKIDVGISQVRRVKKPLKMWADTYNYYRYLMFCPMNVS